MAQAVGCLAREGAWRVPIAFDLKWRFHRMAANRVMTSLALAGFLALGALRPAAADIPPDFPAWLDGMRDEAAAAGISQATIDAALTDVVPVQRILERDRNQAEFKLTFEDYYGRVAKPETIATGRQMLAENRALLDKVAAQYGVQPRFILAIWGIETRYGAVRGTMPVVPALATLAYDARRSKFFRKELVAALRMVDRNYIDLPSMKGSWAGAMGQPQFIPTSYLAYAQDFDGDGRRDIWTNRGDVFASIANYLARHGWSDDVTWGREVRLPDGFEGRLAELKRTGRSGCRAIDRMSVAKSLPEWQAMGVRRTDGTDLPTRDLQASLVRSDGAGGRSFLVYRNYHSILRYNCAHHYGLTVSMLADRIARR